MLNRWSKVLSCSECSAFEDNPAEFVKEMICPSCDWGRKYFNPYLDRIRHYLGLQDAGCPVGRHELTDEDWLLLGIVKRERELIIAEEMRNKN